MTSVSYVVYVQISCIEDLWFKYEIDLCLVLSG